MSRAFVLEPTELSVAKAAEFGEICYFYPSRKDHPGPMTPYFSVSLLSEAHRLRFDPDEDYVVITGQVLQMTSMVATLVAHYGKLKALYFNGHASVRKYQCIVIGEQLLPVNCPRV